MVDHEVENTLREIRERVRAAAPAGLTTTATSAEATPLPASLPAVAGRAGASEALALLEANLATTERAWSRLPPLLSYRRGAAARLELWVKRLVKRALHWFTWEQVNFNSAAHHALREALSALKAHEQLLASARAETDALRRRAEESEAHARDERARLEAHAERRQDQLREQLRDELRRELHEQLRAQLYAELRAGLGPELRDELRDELHARLRGELQADLRAPLYDELHERLGSEQRAELEQRLNAELRPSLRDEINAGLGNELRARLAELTDEQRVCFRQLSLEATEAAVAHDRARRLLEARLERIEQKVMSDE